jgi:hypothetical protein
MAFGIGMRMLAKKAAVARGARVRALAHGVKAARAQKVAMVSVARAARAKKVAAVHKMAAARFGMR